MINKNIFENVPLAIVLIIISAATSFAITQQKVGILEKATDKVTQDVDILKSSNSKQEIINQNIKETVSETKDDVKELLRRIKK